MSPNDGGEGIRVAVVYRVLQAYRIPLFERLARRPELRLKVLHGTSVPGTKVVNGENDGRVDAETLWSLRGRLRTRNGMAVVSVSPGLYRALNRFRPDVIVCEGPSNLLNNLIVWAYLRLHDVGMVQWSLGAVKGRTPSRLRRLLQPLIGAIERRADVCIAYSSRGAAYYREVGVPEDRIVVATNVVDTESRLAEVARLPRQQLYEEAHRDSDFVVLFVGGLNPAKRVDMLLEAFGRIADEAATDGRRPVLWIVGDGPQREELERLAGGMGSRVRFFGRVTEGVSRLFVAADVFVLPGLGGLAISDAMAHGLPVIASIGDGAEADLVTPETGILDEQLDTDRLVDHLRRLRADPGLQARLAAGARREIESGANIANYVARVSEAIHLAHARRPAGS